MRTSRQSRYIIALSAALMIVPVTPVNAWQTCTTTTEGLYGQNSTTTCIDDNDFTPPPPPPLIHSYDLSPPPADKYIIIQPTNRE